MTSTAETLTQCPHCLTRFHVTGTQLSAAHGKVRCGQCLQIFNALEEAIEEEPGETDVAPDHRVQGSDSAAASDRNNENEEDLVFDDSPEEDAREGNYAGHKYYSGTDDELSDAFQEIERGETPHFHDAFSEDEPLDDALLGDDEHWTESLLADDELPEPPPLESDSDPASPRHQPPHSRGDHLQTKEPIWANLSSQPIAAPYVDRVPLRRRLLWSAAALAAAALLVYQVGWAHFDRLALYEPLRPWYARVCSWADCELPLLQAVDRIRTRELVVRSHPDEDDALLLEVTLVNEANFEQPFPAITLTFSNLNRDIVAQRILEPGEYLAGDDPATASMRPSQARRIRLGLRDPGKDAINYRIDLRASQQRSGTTAPTKSTGLSEK